MSAIEASSVRVSTLADGTLRLSVDIEPRFAQAAFALFGAPGTPMALAALACATSEPAKKGGTIAQWLGMRCQEPEFQDWLTRAYPAQWRDAFGATDAAKAGSVVRAVCSVESRAELDHNEAAAQRFHTMIRLPFARATA